MTASAYRRSGDRLLLDVRVTPRARHAGVGGLHVGADDKVSLVVRVTALPAGGAANKAVIDVLARALGLPKASLALKSGAGGRAKTVEVSDASAATVARLDALCLLNEVERIE